MSRKKRGRFIWVVGLALTMACNSTAFEAEQAERDMRRETHGVVEGTVEDSGGSPLGEASVRIRVIRPKAAAGAETVTLGECSGVLAADESTRTDAAGTFAAYIVSSEVTAFSACIALEVEAPTAGQPSSRSFSGFPLEFIAASAPAETLVVDLTL